MMQELFAQPYFGVLLTIAAYWAGMKIQHKTRLAICNGMLLAVLLVIAVLLVFHIPYESYYQGGALINLFLGPATACMAVTIYSQRRLLAKHWLPVLVGCTVGVVTAMGLGIGACSHAMGTAKALELGETEGAMSGLAIGLCGILTTVLALFAGFFWA